VLARGEVDARELGEILGLAQMQERGLDVPRERPGITRAVGKGGASQFPDLSIAHLADALVAHCATSIPSSAASAT